MEMHEYSSMHLSDRPKCASLLAMKIYGSVTDYYIEAQHSYGTLSLGDCFRVNIYSLICFLI